MAVVGGIGLRRIGRFGGDAVLRHVERQRRLRAGRPAGGSIASGAGAAGWSGVASLPASACQPSAAPSSPASAVTSTAGASVSGVSLSPWLLPLPSPSVQPSEPSPFQAARIHGGFGREVGLFLGARILGLHLDQALPVGDRDLVVVGVDFAESEESVAVAAVFHEGGLQAGFHPHHLGQVDVALEGASGGGLEVEFLDAVAIQHHHPGFLGVGCVDQHALGHGRCVSAPRRGRRRMGMAGAVRGESGGAASLGMRPSVLLARQARPRAARCGPGVGAPGLMPRCPRTAAGSGGHRRRRAGWRCGAPGAGERGGSGDARTGFRAGGDGRRGARQGHGTHGGQERPPRFQAGHPMIRAGRAPPMALGSLAGRNRPGLRPQRQPPGQGTIVAAGGLHNPHVTLNRSLRLSMASPWHP